MRSCGKRPKSLAGKFLSRRVYLGKKEPSELVRGGYRQSSFQRLDAATRGELGSVLAAGNWCNAEAKSQFEGIFGVCVEMRNDKAKPTSTSIHTVVTKGTGDNPLQSKHPIQDGHCCWVQAPRQNLPSKPRSKAINSHSQCPSMAGV